MHLSDIQTIFNRAWAHTFDLFKLLIVFLTLAIGGILIVLFRGLATFNLTMLPVFLTFGILLPVGIVVIRAYHDELKAKKIDYKAMLKKSWEVIIGSSYFAIPILLGYLILWMFLGIFVLLKSLPGLGEFFKIIFAFAPFLLNLGTLLLLIVSVGILFFVTPIIALKGFNRILISEQLTARFNRDLFSNTLLFIIACFPLALIVSLLLLSAALTQSLYDVTQNPLYATIQWLIIMLPFTALLSPPLLFFFNFATESHILLKR